MADESLKVTITADAGSAAQQVQDLAKKLDDLEKAFNASAAGAKSGSQAAVEHGAAHAVSAGHVAEHASILGRFAEAAETAGTHTRTVAIAAEQLGLDAAAAATRVDGLAEVLVRLKDAAPELLVLGAAVTAVGIAFVTLKESVDIAAESQRELVAVGALIKNQGAESWKEQTESVETFAASLAKAGVFAKGEYLSGMHEMLAYGVSLNDTLRSQHAAEDLAVAKNISLVESENVLAMAYDGRLMALKRLGLVTADEVKNGVPYEDLLQRIEARMGGSAAAALDTYAGKMKNFGIIVEEIHDTIGTALLPVFETMADSLRAGATSLEPLAAEFAKWSTAHMPQFKAAVSEIGRVVGSIVLPAIETMVSGVQIATGVLLDLGAWFNQHSKDISDFFSGLGSVALDFGQALTTVATVAFPAFKLGADGAVTTLGDLGRILQDLKPELEAVFTVLIAKTAVDAFLALRTAALAAIAAMVATEWWTVLALGVEAVAAAFKSGLTPAIVSNIAAWGELAVAEAAATLGLSAVVAGLVAGTVYLWNNWDETLGAAGHLWATLRDNVANAAAGIESSIAGMFDKLAWQAHSLPVIGDKIASFFTDAANEYKKGANDLASGALPQAHRVIQDALTGQWIDSVTLEPAKPPNGARGPGGGQGDPKNMGGTSWGDPPTKPSSHIVPGSSTAKPKAESAPGSVSFTPADYKTEKVDEYAAAQKNLEAALKRVDDGEKSLAERVKTATTAQGEAAAQTAYDAQVTIDLLAKKSMLTSAIRDENAELDGSRDLQKGAIQYAKERTDAYNAAGEAMLKSGDGSTATANRIAVLKDEMDKANKAAADLAAGIKALESDLRTNAGSLADVNAKLDEFKNKAAEAFATASRSWEEHHRTTMRGLAEDLATWSMTNEQKAAFYGATLARLQAMDAGAEERMAAAQAELAAAGNAKDDDRVRKAQAANTAIEIAHKTAVSDMEQAESKYTEAYKAALHDREAQQKAYVDRVRGYETSFLDDVLLRHQSLGQSLKNIFGNILTDWVHMIEQMVVKSTLLNTLNSPNGAFGKVFQSIGLGAAIGTGTMGAAPDPRAQAAYDSYIASQTHATQVTSVYATSQDGATRAVSTATTALGTFTSALQRAASVAGSGAPGSGAGGFLGMQDGVPSFDGGSFDVGSVLDPGGWANSPNLTQGALDVNLDSVGGTSIPTGSSVPTSLAKIESGAMQGLMIAQVVTGITGGNSTWGSVGGAVGGAFGGPIGAAVGAALGGMFGNHSLGPAKQPDIYNTAAWGQGAVDWNGAMGAQTFNGQSFTAASQYNVGMGGTPMYKLMEQWANAGAATTDAQKALQAQIKGLEGGNPNADFGVVREANNIAYLANGQTMKVPDLLALEQAYQTNVGSGGLASSDVFSMTRTYPDFAGHLSPNGTYTPTPVTVAPGAAPGASAVTPGASSIIGAPVVNVHVEVQGDILGTPEDFANRVGPALAPVVSRALHQQSNDLRSGSSQWSPSGVPGRYTT